MNTMTDKNHNAPELTIGTSVCLRFDGKDEYAAVVDEATADKVVVRTEGAFGYERLTFRPRRDTSSLDWVWAHGPYQMVQQDQGTYVVIINQA